MVIAFRCKIVGPLYTPYQGMGDRLLTSVTEKAAGGRHTISEPDLEAPLSLKEAPAGERGDRFAGILLIVAGCLLMALAAGLAP